MNTSNAMSYQQLLSPNGSLSVQSGVSAPRERGGIHKLMAALLLDGIEAYVQEKTNPSRNKKTHDEVCSWIESSEASYVFSFENVCETLGIEPAYLRLGIQRFIESQNESGGIKTWKKIRRQRTPKQDTDLAC